MTLLSYIFLLIIYFHFTKLQITESNLDLIEQTTNIIDNETPIDRPRHVTILGILTTDEDINILRKTTNHSNENFSMSAESFVIDSNPLVTMDNLCTIGNTSYAKVIIAGKLMDDNDNDLTLTAISYIADYYRIPLIILASRENIFSDNTLYHYMIRLSPPYLYEADAWFRMIREWKYTRVVLIHSHEEESRMVISRFQMLTDDSDVQIERIEEYDYETNLTSLLTNLTAGNRISARVFIIHPRLDDVNEFLSVIAQLQLLENFAWILNEHALTSQKSELFDGILGVRLHDSFNEQNLVVDASQLILNTFNKFVNYSSSFWSPNHPVIDCSLTIPWSYGKEVYHTLITTKVEFGRTGNIEFNEQGDRIESLYDIVNIQNSQPIIVGSYRSNTSTCKTGSQCREIIEKADLKLNQDKIIWPNGLRRKPDGVRTRRNVSVVTIAEKPFIFTRPGNKCDPMSEVLCPRKKLQRNITDKEYDDYCCSGFCIALLQELSKNLSFVYTVHLVADGKYGSFEQEGDDKHKRWDGMIGELVNYTADMIIAPLTMNPERAEDIEFTKPFKYQGITILVRKTKDTSNLSSFLRPFKSGLWLMILLSIHAVAVALYLLDRYSPLGRFRAANEGKNKYESDKSVVQNEEEQTLTFSHALWFTWSTFLNSGIGEGTPISFSARVLGMVWAGFAMIMVASYTANLAAFLVLDRPEETLSGINDARLRNPQDAFIYATVKGSSVDMYFKRQVELSTMYRTMESKNYRTPEEAIEDLRNGKLHAFIWDSPRLEYEAGLDCDLVTVGELFGRSSYGIALRKKDPWINPLSHAILSFHEKGFMELLDNQWIFSKHEQDCLDSSSSPATLRFHNMLDLFLLITGGVIVGSVILFLEIIFKRHKEQKEVDDEISRTTVHHWKKQIEKRKHPKPISELQEQKQEIPKSKSADAILSNRINNRLSTN